jgi:hypothetical protein
MTQVIVHVGLADFFDGNFLFFQPSLTFIWFHQPSLAFIGRGGELRILNFEL